MSQVQVEKNIGNVTLRVPRPLYFYFREGDSLVGIHKVGLQHSIDMGAIQSIFSKANLSFFSLIKLYSKSLSQLRIQTNESPS